MAQLHCDATGVLLSEGNSYESCTSTQQGRLNVPMEDICGEQTVLGEGGQCLTIIHENPQEQHGLRCHRFSFQPR